MRAALRSISARNSANGRAPICASIASARANGLAAASALSMRRRMLRRENTLLQLSPESVKMEQAVRDAGVGLSPHRAALYGLRVVSYVSTLVVLRPLIPNRPSSPTRPMSPHQLFPPLVPVVVDPPVVVVVVLVAGEAAGDATVVVVVVPVVAAGLACASAAVGMIASAVASNKPAAPVPRAFFIRAFSLKSSVCTGSLTRSALRYRELPVALSGLPLSRRGEKARDFAVFVDTHREVEFGSAAKRNQIDVRGVLRRAFLSAVHPSLRGSHRFELLACRREDLRRDRFVHAGIELRAIQISADEHRPYGFDASRDIRIFPACRFRFGLRELRVEHVERARGNDRGRCIGAVLKRDDSFSQFGIHVVLRCKPERTASVRNARRAVVRADNPAESVAGALAGGQSSRLRHQLQVRRRDQLAAEQRAIPFE